MHHSYSYANFSSWYFAWFECVLQYSSVCAMYFRKGTLYERSSGKCIISITVKCFFSLYPTILRRSFMRNFFFSFIRLIYFMFLLQFYLLMRTVFTKPFYQVLLFDAGKRTKRIHSSQRGSVSLSILLNMEFMIHRMFGTWIIIIFYCFERDKRLPSLFLAFSLSLKCIDGDHFAFPFILILWSRAQTLYTEFRYCIRFFLSPFFS